MSIPPPGGSTRITSAPSAASVAPPSGAATNAESSMMRSPARIAASAGPGVIQGLGSLLLQAGRQSLVDVFEDRPGSGPWQLLDLTLRNFDLGANLVERRGLLGGCPGALAGRESPDAFYRVTLLGVIELGLVAVLLRVVRGVVESHPVGAAFDQRRPAPGKRAVDRLDRCRVHRKQVVAVHDEPRDAVALGSSGQLQRGGLLVYWDRDRVVFVDQHHDQRPAHHTGKVRSFVEVAFR